MSTPNMAQSVATSSLSELARHGRLLLASLAELTSETRLYDLEVQGLHAPLAVESFISYEALSAPYEITVYALSTDALIDLDSLLWQPVRLWITHSDGHRRARSGYVREAEALECDGGLARYALTLVPWLWLATQQTHSRLFQNQRVPEILDSVLAPYAAHGEWQLAEGTQQFLEALPARRVCTQYRETDHAFVQRLLREEGLGYYFEELPLAAGSEPRGQRLVIFSDSQRLAEDESSRSSLGGLGVRFHRHSSQQDQDSVQTLNSLRQFPSAGVTAAAWDPETRRLVAASLHSRGAVTSNPAATAPPLERYLWAGHGRRASAAEVERSVQLAQEAIETGHKRFDGTGTVRSFRPGRCFALRDSPEDGTSLFRQAGQSPDGQHRQDPQAAAALAPDERVHFVLTSVHAVGINNLPLELKQSVQALLGHSKWRLADTLAAQAGAGADADALQVLAAAAEEQGYSCRFQALRSFVPWRPLGAGERCGALSDGPQTALVVGVPGDSNDELHRDSQGRIQVRFHWQRGETPQDTHSGWVRIAQRYAGAGIGSSFIPRIGQEVLVGFIDHDIDQPVVMGALYNGRGEGGEPVTPGGASGSAEDRRAVFAQASDRQPSAQGNTRGGHAPAWHGASPDREGHRNAAGLSGIKTHEFSGQGHNQLQLDDHEGELRSQLASTQAASQLNLGHLIHTADNHRGSWRGSGFELRTDESGAIRGGAGVLLTTWHDAPAPGANQPIGEITGPLALLHQAKGLSEAFDTASRNHKTIGLSSHRGSVKAQACALSDAHAPLAAVLKAASATVDAEEDSKALADAAQSLAGRGVAGGVQHLGKPMVITAGRAGLGLVAGQAIQLASGDSTLMATGGDLNLAGGQRLTVHSGQAIGLLAGAAGVGEKGMGLSLIAAQGPINLHAQADKLNLDSQKALQIVSANAEAVLAAAQSIKLATAGGSSIEIEGGNITVQCPGTLTVHAAQHQFTGPTQLSREMNSWPETKFDERFKVVFGDGSPAKGYQYAIYREDGAIIKGVTDSEGWTTMQKAIGPEKLVVELLGPGGEKAG